MGQITVLCDRGDIVVSWNPKDEESVQRARDEFASLQKDGYEMLKPTAKRKTRVQHFDPKYGEIIAVPGVKTKTDKKEGTRPRAMAGQPIHRSAETLRAKRMGIGPFSSR